MRSGRRSHPWYGVDRDTSSAVLPDRSERTKRTSSSICSASETRQRPIFQTRRGAGCPDKGPTIRRSPHTLPPGAPARTQKPSRFRATPSLRSPVADAALTVSETSPTLEFPIRCPRRAASIAVWGRGVWRTRRSVNGCGVYSRPAGSPVTIPSSCGQAPAWPSPAPAVVRSSAPRPSTSWISVVLSRFSSIRAVTRSGTRSASA
jgi:hypothetical protein